MQVRAAIISGFGINAEEELKQAFQIAGSNAELVHVKTLIEQPGLMHEFHILGFPGGFSFGDHLGSGLVFAQLFKKHLLGELDRFIADKKIVIGICNGFQVLTKIGVLPNINQKNEPEVSLVHNRHGAFEDSWVSVAFNGESPCVWTSELKTMDVPIRHGEGRFIVKNQSVLEELENQKLVAIRYLDRNPNGSTNDIAGITDPTGHILGLMPHPEAFLIPQNHPKWTRNRVTSPLGTRIFENGVNYIKMRYNKR